MCNWLNDVLCMALAMLLKNTRRAALEAPAKSRRVEARWGDCRLGVAAIALNAIAIFAGVCPCGEFSSSLFLLKNKKGRILKVQKTACGS
jgi:hypothetical protein